MRPDTITRRATVGGVLALLCLPLPVAKPQHATVQEVGRLLGWLSGRRLTRRQVKAIVRLVA